MTIKMTTEQLLY